VTVFSPLKAYGAGPGKKVGVIGIGGLGHLGLQFAAALGADVWAISHSERKRADALAMGAKGFIATGGSDAAVLKEHGNSFDMILCTSFQDGMPLQELYLPLLRPHGNMVVVGLPNEGVPRGGRALFGKSLTASLIGSVPDLYDMFEVAVKHGVKPWVETRPMSQASQAVQDMEDGKSKYRYVLVNEQ
jgi:alcohol dehydrogenase (NADP+)